MNAQSLLKHRYLVFRSNLPATSWYTLRLCRTISCWALSDSTRVPWSPSVEQHLRLLVPYACPRTEAVSPAAHTPSLGHFRTVLPTLQTLSSQMFCPHQSSIWLSIFTIVFYLLSCRQIDMNAQINDLVVKLVCCMFLLLPSVSITTIVTLQEQHSC